MEKTNKQPKFLVAYQSQTGNTQKVAEAIYNIIPEPKQILRIQDVNSLEDYSISFLGFPVHQMGPDKKAKAFLETHVKNKTIALFITHMAPEAEPKLKEWMDKFTSAAVGADVLGVFNCQGQASRIVKGIMRLSPNSQIRAGARNDSSQGQPDTERLDKARDFAAEIINRLNGGSKLR